VVDGLPRGRFIAKTPPFKTSGRRLPSKKQ
jgi:hypothetical protein